LLKKLFDFFIFTSLFIACCAVLMVYQAFLLFGLSFPPALYFFVFFGTVCSYNFHWYLTPPGPYHTFKLYWNFSNRKLHGVLFILSLVGAAVCALFLNRHWLWLFFTALFTFLYSAPKIPNPLFVSLRKIAVGKTIYLALAWTHVTAMLPLLIAAGHLLPVYVWYSINRLFFLYTVCIVFDRRDVEADRRAGIKSLVTALNEKGVDCLFWFSGLVVLVTGGILGIWLPVPAVVILLVPSAVLALLYQQSKQSHSDYLYYFLLDGLMALSAPLLILAKFAR
jgi:4-hydroxybenzoate polyprenyltransferase